MTDPDQLPEGPPPPPPQGASDDDFPEIRRRLWDLEWRLRRESGTAAERLADVFKMVFQAPSWSGEALAEGLMPALSDFKRRIIALETKATEGTAPQHPAFVALADRVEILERLIEEGVAVQRAELAALDGRMDGMEGRVLAMEAWGERLEALEAQATEAAATIADLQAGSDVIRELLATHEGAADLLASRVDGLETSLGQATENLQQVAGEIQALDERDREQQEGLEQQVGALEELAGMLDVQMAGATEQTLGADLRLQALEDRAGVWDMALEETAGDLVIRVGGLEKAAERIQRDLLDRVPAAQFAGVSLSMASQQAAIKDLKAQIAALRAGGPLPPSETSGTPPLEVAPALDTAQVEALWDHVGRLEERVAKLMPEFDRLGADIQESRKGLKSLLSNWMELEGKLGYYAEKRRVDQIEARIMPPAAFEAVEHRVGDLEVAALALQEGLREIAGVLTGGMEDD